MSFSLTAVLWSGVFFPVAILALYWLRRRYRRKEVSALFLWRSPGISAGEGRRFSRLENNLLLLLELLAASCLVCAAAGPGCSDAGRAEKIVIILDSSASMGRESVKEAVRKEFLAMAKAGKQDGIVLIFTGPHPVAANLVPISWEEAVSRIESWTPRHGAHDFRKSFALASLIASGKGRILFFSDFMPERVRKDSSLMNGGEEEKEEGGDGGNGSRWKKPPEVDWRAVGGYEPNYGIVNASRRRDYENFQEEFFVEAVNFSDSPVRLKLSFFEGQDAGSFSGLPVAEQELSAEARERVHAVFRFPRMTPAPFLVRLSPGGALAGDDSVILLSDARPPLRIGLDFRKNSPLESLAEKTLRALEPEALRSSPDKAHLILTDNPAGIPVPGAWKMLFLSGDPGKAEIFHGPYIPEKGHPLLKDLSFRDFFRWAVVPGIFSPESSRKAVPLLSCGGVPLLGEILLPGAPKAFLMNYIPERSNLHRTALWPLLMRNLMELRKKDMEGFAARNLRQGEIVECCFPGREVLEIRPAAFSAVGGSGRNGNPAMEKRGKNPPKEAEGKTEEGTNEEEDALFPADDEGRSAHVPLREGKGKFLADAPGLYRVSDGKTGKDLGMLSVLRVSPEESDLSGSVSGRAEAEIAPGGGALADSIGARLLRRDDAWMFLLAALALLVLRAGLILRSGGKGKEKEKLHHAS